jgi:hypothetical protein
MGMKEVSSCAFADSGTVVGDSEVVAGTETVVHGAEWLEAVTV